MTDGAADPRLAAFLGAESDDDAETALAAIFDEAMERLLTDCVRRGLFGSAHGVADAEDVASETRVRLIRRLWALRLDRAEIIEDFSAYVATTATRTCYAHLRARFPARTRFRNQVRYSVARHPDTTLEESGGVWRCRTLRLATSPRDVARSGQGPRLVPSRGAVQQFTEAPRAFLSQARIDPSASLPQVIASLLARLDAPIELDRLVDALALVLGIVEARAVREDDPSGAQVLESVPDQSPGTLRTMSDREELQALWREVIELPPNQRIALLLNLRDPDGGAALHALPVTGLVTRAELARLLELDEAALASLWDRLPLDDLSIGARLGMTRQQVINLRKAARARLARRTDRQ
jgi:DNA-directed RNA polymerase specialized sigma24 family protein